MSKINLDFDKNRIKSVLSETYKAASELLDTSFDISSEEFISRIDPYIESNRTSIPVHIDLPSRQFPGLKIEVDLRRAKVFARIPSRSRVHPKQALLNYFLKTL